MTLRDITHIGRPLDPAWPTNRAIGFITIIVWVIAGVVGMWKGLGIVDANWNALLTSGNVFLAWAIGRELDPDRQPPAFLASGIILMAITFTSAPSLLPALWILLLLRVMNRTTGLKATLFDMAACAVVGLTLVLLQHPIFGLLTALILFLDDRLDGTYGTGTLLAIALVVVTTVLQMTLDVPESSPSALAALAAAMSAVVFIPVYRRCATMEAPGDDTGVCLLPRRVRAAQATSLLAGILVAVVSGYAGLFSMAAFWSAVLAAGVYRT